MSRNQVDEAITYTFSLKDGQHVSFDDIPAGTGYTVSEDNAGETASNYVVTINGTAVPGVDGVYSTEGTMTKGDEDEAAYINSYRTPAQLTIEKIVKSGIEEELNNGLYSFEIKFTMEAEREVEEQIQIGTDGNDQPIYETLTTIETYDAPYDLADIEWPSNAAAHDFTLTEEGTGTYTFTLGAGEALQFDNLPIGVSYAVEETDDGGAKSTTDSGNTEGEIYGDSSGLEGITVSFTNNFERDPGTLTVTKDVQDPDNRENVECGIQNSRSGSLRS